MPASARFFRAIAIFEGDRSSVTTKPPVPNVDSSWRNAESFSSIASLLLRGKCVARNVTEFAALRSDSKGAPDLRLDEVGLGAHPHRVGMIPDDRRRRLPLDPALAVWSASVVALTRAVDVDEVHVGFLRGATERVLEALAKHTQERRVGWFERRARGPRHP